MESFRVIKKIGQGGFGKVYLVKSLENDELRVVKQVNIEKMDKDIVPKVMEEIKIMSKLNHFNIVHYRSHIIHKGSLLILMDYAEGGDIATLIHDRNGKSMNEDIIIDYFVQMCLAVKYLHDRKIIHRDIKSSNFFLCKNGLIKLGDFGLSRLLPTTKAMLDTQIGSPYYLSPELCIGKEYNMKTDIWSLGIVLYEMCSLRHPFLGRTTHEIMENILRSKTPLIPSIYDIDLQKIAKMMLTRDPEKRPTINQILQTPLIRYKAYALLGRTQARIELSHTIFHGYAPGVTPEDFPDEILFVDDYHKLKDEIKTNIVEKDDQITLEQNDDYQKNESLFIHNDPKNHKNKKDDYELIDFMGIPMRLPYAKKSSSPQEKADDLRGFIECLVGKNKLDEIHSVVEKSKKGSLALHFKYPYKKQFCIIKLVEKLIEYEKQINEI